LRHTKTLLRRGRLVDGIDQRYIRQEETALLALLSLSAAGCFNVGAGNTLGEDGDGPPTEIQPLGVAALAEIQPRQVVEAGGDVGMIGPKRLLADCQAALVEGLGRGVAALVAIQRRQVVEAVGIGTRCSRGRGASRGARDA
jgi:hypothetical protein